MSDFATVKKGDTSDLVVNVSKVAAPSMSELHQPEVSGAYTCTQRINQTTFDVFSVCSVPRNAPLVPLSIDPRLRFTLTQRHKPLVALNLICRVDALVVDHEFDVPTDSYRLNSSVNTASSTGTFTNS